jgi:phosphoribosylformylglycinamidine synthase
MPTLAVITFPGNNCDTESARAATRNGFTAEQVLWNEIDRIGEFDAYLLEGGFSFEDRGRSGAIAAREPIFDALREEAKKGKLILGVCNGAQMIVESGLIPVAEDPLPFSLAKNLRLTKEVHILGKGYYNTWCYLKAEREDTAFTNKIEKVLHVPIAHGEGRFASIDEVALASLKSGKNVAFRYCDEGGQVSDKFPTTPNHSVHATAAIVNNEGTIMGIMPHPERFYKAFDGDQIFQSMKAWIEDEKSPAQVKIGDLSHRAVPESEIVGTESPRGIWLEKTLMITDNENFSVKRTAESVCGSSIDLEKSVVLHISGDITRDQVLDSGLIFNPNKERCVDLKPKPNQYLVENFDDELAWDLSEAFSEMIGKESSVTVQVFVAWDFKGTSQDLIDRVLKNGLLCNPNSGRICKTNPEL